MKIPAVTWLLGAVAVGVLLMPCTAETFERPFLPISDFTAHPLATMSPPGVDPLERGVGDLPTMYPLVPGFGDTLPPRATRMRFRGPGGKACDCPLGGQEDSVCLYSDGQAFTNDCVAQCYGHRPRDYYRCKVKIPLFRKLN